MVNISLKLLGNKILVKPEKKKELTQGGLIIPIVVNKDLEEAEVLLVSPDVIHVSVGDKIMYPTGAGTPILIEQETYKFLNGPTKDSTGDIIAITEAAIKANF